MAKLTPRERVEAQEVFVSKGACEDCGGYHARACPRIKRIHLRFTETRGTQVSELIEREVEYWEAGHWPTGDIIFPEDAFEDDEPDE